MTVTSTDIGTDVVLRDGSTVRVRPARATDRDGLAALFDGLTLDSRRMRFFSASANIAQAARWASEADRPERLSLVATAGPDATVIAHAVLVALDAERAEVAFAIADDFHRRGLGTLMLAHLADAARARGIRTFVALVLPENEGMLGLLSASGFAVAVSAEPGRVVAEFPTTLSVEGRERFERRDDLAAAAAVERVLAPSSVAVIGASTRPDTLSGALTGNLLGGGFHGDLHLVNVRGGEIEGRPVHRSILDVEGDVDLAVVAVPAERVPAVARECARKGVRALVVISAGFAEAGGADRQRELVEACRAGGMRLVGPNCLGVMNLAAGLDATFSPVGPLPGSVAFMSQSGGIGVAVLEQARDLGLGLSAFVSVGNKADLSGNDLLRYWEHDEATQVVLLYLESLGNPRAFARIAPRVARRKPVLAVKSGRSPAGARAAGSHTGALLAASDATIDALFRQAGVIRADTLGELFDVARLLERQPVPLGRSVAILTNAGGPGILAVDACAGQGLEVPTLAPETQAALRAFVVPEASVSNPVDLVACATAHDYERALRLLMADPAIDAVIVAFVPPLVTRTADVARAVAAVARESERRIPVLGVFMTSEAPPPELRAAGVPLYPFPEDAARALGRAAWYGAWRRSPRGEAIVPAGVRRYEATAVIAGALADGPGWLDPERVAALCDCYGVPIADWRLARSAEAAVRAARELGGAVALKAVAPTLVHKSDAGGVRLGLRGPGTVRRTATQMAADVVAAGHEAPAFLVQRMAAPGVEMLVGVANDPQFGPVIACGAGGTAVELLHDVAVRITPLTDRDAAEMVRSLRTFPLLDGYRGAARADVAALEDLLLRVGAMVEAHPQIAELECNPVVVGPGGCTAVDVRVRVEPVPAASIPLVAGALRPLEA